MCTAFVLITNNPVCSAMSLYKHSLKSSKRPFSMDYNSPLARTCVQNNKI